MYPYQSLPENLAAFSRRLRRDHGFRLGPRELQDAARALGVAHLADERNVRDVLRPVFCGTIADLAVFDRAFDDFFHPAPHHGGFEAPVRSRVQDGPGDQVLAGHDGETFGTAAESSGNPVQGPDDRLSPIGIDDAADEQAAGLLRSTYSPLDAEGTAPRLTPPDEAWRAAAAAFIAGLRAGLSRRWRPARHGQRFDLRRTLRNSLHTGGEAVVPRWQARPRRRPRVVLLVDGSRSMSPYAQIALDMTVAMASVTPNVEAFTFSTTLQRVTRDVRRAAAGEARRLRHLHYAWGGGTTIGACLQGFLRRFGERLLDRDTVVVIASDGLDVGAVPMLRDTMERLRRRAAAVIWLNPLLELAGYEPTALGMAAARPHVSLFACVTDPAGLIRLSRAVRLRQ
jgi:uncharacterized protein with von Willebrand factor type A (vWA) domain